MLKLKYFAAFASNELFGSSFVKKLYDYFDGDIEKAWFATSFDLKTIGHITEKKINSFLRLRDNINPDNELEKLKNTDINIITYDDNDYPKLLKQTEDAPMWIYYIGNKNLFNAKYNIAVVGSRKCSTAGKNVLSKIIGEFANLDLCITSGLAAGIDTTAHQAAIDNNLSTIAVLGSGLKEIYPAQNKTLYQKIIDKNGLVISEYPIYSRPETYHFPQRNRIISGLCPCTLVAEATLKSGALITARLCLEQNRELMCIPGAITNPGTEGIYHLLKNGAGIVTCGDDILNIMSWNINKISSSQKSKNNLSKEETEVLKLIRQDFLSLDELAIKTGLHTDNLMIILTRLEIEDYIMQTDGGNYIAK
ncbi:DNA-processing protein DprA [bacterium]|nr:DNA-processing protein DprA [bacterium]